MFEKDNFDELTTSLDPDLTAEDNDNDNVQEVNGRLEILESFQSTNAGEYIINVREDNQNKGAFKDITINGSTIMNQCGSLLTRKKHQIRGSNKQKFFLPNPIISATVPPYPFCAATNSPLAELPMALAQPSCV